MSINIWIVIGISIYLIHSYFIFNFAFPLLKYPTKRIFVFVLIPIINTVVFTIAYFLGFSFVALYGLSYGMYMLFFKFSSKAPFRQILFGASSYLINLSSVHFFVILCTGALFELSIASIFSSTTLFFGTIAVSYTLLIGVLELAKRYLSAKRLQAVSTASGYSEIMGISSTILMGIILLDSWILINSSFSVSFFVASITTIVFVLVMYYCLFFVNTYILILHPYKRKADEAVSLRGKVHEKKVAAEYKLYTDDLTHLYNKRFIYHKLDELCENEESHFAIIYADLAALKSVNDTFGHKTGDRYILSVSHAFQKAVREEDFCARVGGDEFIVVLPDVSDEILDSVVLRIQQYIKAKNNKESYTVHANLGFKSFDQKKHKHSRTEVLEIVDALMKQDKQNYYSNGGV